MKKSTVFPWSEHLPQGDAETMYADIAACAKAYYSGQTTVDFAENLETLLSAWKTKAEAHTDPGLWDASWSPSRMAGCGSIPKISSGWPTSCLGRSSA